MPEIIGRSYKGHAYWLLDGRKTPSPSKIKLEAPYLDNYHASEAIDAVIDTWDDLLAMPDQSMRRKALLGSVLARYSYAAERGRECHRLMEALVNGIQATLGDPMIVTDPVLAARLQSDPSIPRDAEAAARALALFRIDPVFTEQPIINRKWQYTGTCDLIATSPAFGDDQPTILDYKFTKQVWPDYALQQSAYSHATDLLVEVKHVGPRGGKQPSTWELEPVELRRDRAYVLNTRDGVASMHPIVTGGDVWRAVQAWVTAYWAFDPQDNNPVLDPIQPGPASMAAGDDDYPF
jgi:hypothetical protein